MGGLDQVGDGEPRGLRSRSRLAEGTSEALAMIQLLLRVGREAMGGL